MFIGGIQISQVSQMKSLGANFDSNLKWDTHILKTCGKARKFIGMIQHCMPSTDHKTKLTLFKEIVLPILKYGIQVRSPHTKGLIK